MKNSFPEELIKTGYVSAGRFVSSDEWIHPKRIIDSYEIIYVLEGDVFIQQDEARLQLKENELIVLQPFKTHFGYKSSTGRTSFYWLHYTDPDMYTFCNIKRHIRFDGTHNINLLLKQILHMANTPGYPQYSLDILLWLILTEITVEQSVGCINSNPLLKDVCEWIRINNDKNITVTDVAREFEYSEDHISRIFKKNYSIGLKKYINEIKMNVIKNHLLSGSQPIKEVAANAGFADYKHFLKYFKYHEGISPMEYRQVYFNTHLNKK
jgi:AraC-like DNA-binding protein